MIRRYLHACGQAFFKRGGDVTAWWIVTCFSPFHTSLRIGTSSRLAAHCVFTCIAREASSSSSLLSLVFSNRTRSSGTGLLRHSG
jgi:hypothetical protein